MNSICLPKFIDCLFPPSNESVYKDIVLNSNLITSKIFPKYVITNWLRPENIRFSSHCDKYLKLSVYNLPKPSDIVQGAVGSCWYLASLSSLVGSPFYLENLFIGQCKNHGQFEPISLSGCYHIRLCIRGKWQIVTIDDFLPCNIFGKPVFAAIKNKQIYPALLEKAFAKVHGSYDAISSGTSYEGLQILTGHPCKQIFLKSDRELEDNETVCNEFNWQEIIFAKKSCYLMTALCYNRFLQGDILRLVGLYHAHVYSVLDVREFCYNQKPVRLLKLRNPWGKHEWKGKWSNYRSWPCEIKSQIFDDCESNGTFWIAYEDFLKYFYDFTICKTRPTWTSFRLSSIFKDFSSYVECYTFEVNQSDINQIEIELFFEGKNDYFHDRSANAEIDSFLILCKIDVYGLTCIAHKQKLKTSINISGTLECGRYIVFATSMKAILKAQNLPCLRTCYKFNLVFHTPKEIEITCTMLSANVISDFLYAIVLKENKRSKSHDLFKDLRFTNLSNLCSHAVLAENKSLNNCFIVSVDSSRSSNLERSKSCTESDHLCPGQRQWIFYGVPKNYKRKLKIILDENIQTILYNFTHTYCKWSKSILSTSNSFKGLHTIKNSPSIN